MADFHNYCNWYTVWDAKTGDLIASGTSEMCARRLGYKSANSFASAVSHGLSGSHRTYKYTFARERIDRSEVDSLPPVRTIRKKPAGAPTPTGCKGWWNLKAPSPLMISHQKGFYK